MNNDSYFISFEKKAHICNIKHLQNVEEMISLYDIGNTSRNKRYLFVTDATVASQDNMKNFLLKFDDDICGNDCLFVLGSGEPYKTIDCVISIVDKALEYNFSREDTFVAIGGGVICDITAFAASIYKRGLSVELVPTTFLAMIDNAIGGKTACNHKNHKNIIGTFYPPENIYYITDFVKSLPEIQIKSGLAEALKTGIVCQKDIYETLKTESLKIKESDASKYSTSTELLESLIFKCSDAKSKLVEKDYTDENVRLALNLGHTFGYALETVVGMGVITHGEAVAWGIGRAFCLANQLGYCSDELKDEVLNVLENFGYEINAEPSVVKGGGIGERILETMHQDKKKTGKKVLLVLPKEYSKNSTENATNGLVEIIVEELDDEEILKVLK